MQFPEQFWTKAESKTEGSSTYEINTKQQLQINKDLQNQAGETTLGQ